MMKWIKLPEMMIWWREEECRRRTIQPLIKDFVWKNRGTYLCLTHDTERTTRGFYLSLFYGTLLEPSLQSLALSLFW